MATNQILPFATSDIGTNLLTQAEYASDNQRIIGHQPGIARSKLENKVLRQASLMAAGLAEFIADYQTYDVHDGLTPQQVADYLYQAIQEVIPDVTIPPPFPSGTRLVFAQSSAPSGWVRVTDDSANNRMLRVISSGSVSSGGVHSPILMDVVPAHTHSFTTGANSVDHTHSGTTGGQSADHTHTLTCARVLSTTFDVRADTPSFSKPDIGSVTATTSAASTGHTHAFTTGTQSTSHTHSGSTDNGSSQTNWRPRYLDLILCQKV